MFSKRILLFSILAAFSVSVGAQRIIYSDYDKDDSRKMEFDIAGKVGGHYLIYKNTRNRAWIVVFDNELQQVAKVSQDYVPNNDRLINADFFPYPDFVYMIYQYQKKNVVYCMGAKIDGNGKIMGEPLELDTSHIGFSANNKIYTVVTSDDKSKISVFKINSRNRKLFVMTAMLFNSKLELLKRSRVEIPMEERNENLGDFTVDDDGDLAFCRFFRGNSDNITTASLFIKYATADSLMNRSLNIEKTPLDEIHIKADNTNHRFLITSFYSEERRGSIAGLYFYVWDKWKGGPVMEKTFPIGEEIRKDARGDASVKMAFDDFFIRQIIVRHDGGFILGSEAFYTTSRFNTWNRWDYLYGSPFYSPFYNNSYYSPYFNNSLWYNRYSNSQSVRFHADNIVVFSFNNRGELEWNTVIVKSQYNDESDDLVSYTLMNTGDQLHFLMNIQERKNNLLTDFSISPSGAMNRNPTLKNLDRGYEFMAKYGRQVSAKQMIIPCLYRNYICFAKVDYSQP
jgi:hypothetical protein